MELVVASVLAALIGGGSSLIVVWLNRRQAKIAIDAEVFTRAEKHLNNIIAKQNEVITEYSKTIREQDTKIDGLEEDNRNLKAAHFDEQMNRKRLEIRVQDLENKLGGGF